MRGYSSAHSFELLPRWVYALSYLGLIFSWMLLVLGLLVWYPWSCHFKVRHLCRVPALLEDKKQAVYLEVRTYIHSVRLGSFSRHQKSRLAE